MMISIKRYTMETKCCSFKYLNIRDNPIDSRGYCSNCGYYPKLEELRMSLKELRLALEELKTYIETTNHTVLKEFINGLY